ncbi:MAG: helix-turn-helix transcriptional regulator [Clostridia bacterium]|nr:helix-turn-helix transcriptional regulator [Clostridia bacterium]
MLNLGTKLKELRKEKILTQQELAKSIDLSQSTISCWENGKRTPTVSALIKLCLLFNVSANYLLGLTDIRQRKVTKYSA